MLLGSWKSENGPLPITEYHPRLHPTHSGRPPPPNPSSDTSSWQPAPFNSLQHSLGLGNHWCSAPSVATTPAPSLVGPSHLGPYDGVSSYVPKKVKGAAESEWKIKLTKVWVILKFSTPKMFEYAGNAVYTYNFNSDVMCSTYFAVHKHIYCVFHERLKMCYFCS